MDDESILKDLEAQASCDTERTGVHTRHSTTHGSVIVATSRYTASLREEGDEEIPENWSRVTEEIGDASWNDVYRACCIHSTKGWAKIFGGVLLLALLLYVFILALELLGNSAKVVGGCTAGSLMGDVTNPIAGLVIGELATVLLQSSSTTIAIIVSLVGDSGLDVQQAIYMVMGELDM